MSLKTSDFYYDLPKELIAQHPLEDRSSSRLLIANRYDKNLKEDIFKNIINYLNKGDVLVINNTKVIPARIHGHRKDKEENIEILLLTRKGDIWECLVKPGKKVKIGTEIIFSDKLKAEVIDISEDGNRFIKFIYEGIFEEILDQLGEMPLPPYIKEKLDDQTRYNTVYSKIEGSAAAPTAGLHFTKELLEQIKNKGVKIAPITLHVGLGTFRPVKVEDVEKHHMHSEYYMVSEESASIINDAKKNGNKIIAVGTTSMRTLESVADKNGMLKETRGWTDIFIYPGYEFKCVDSLITNFHLPESTLLMLVSAFSSKDIIFNAYEYAIKNKFRFFSFGDAMFLRGKDV
ncbi:S-adenosylmethionine:tRNA ribosyltransferase-isomerase [Peptoniphilus koenoeneniae]|uniref:S-adenosylmethionine:tRNA ribosyltransferase-isomerase n=1 Tax=Peptoniphilus koenoeneniae TaxID=507751 RepID=A0ABU0AS96_9FIRM|nr:MULTISPECIES: tRNA preQ1(34) S-adenosylmethionine ribosyltransferase-isomerase QueA [Peptoniphilus]ERT56725.1 S-adenosylmethionine:tRNA ribosyltransferase-isomerase [Peptoniphilus sp. BV3C26]MDQ0274134.1 S-adenosylmethionine:tRNA ribosyltransferase-isomerase [Peptoniphilus koenoeneniae]